MMKRMIVLALLWCGPLAQAAPNAEQMRTALAAQPSCGNFVRFDDQNLYFGFGSYRNGLEEPRKPIPAKMQVRPVDGAAAFELATNDAAIDIVKENSSAFILTYSSIEEWDLAKRARVAEYPTYAINGPLAYKQHAQAMARYQDTVIIAHGRLGVSFFDLKKKRITNQFRLVRNQLPMESMAMGVTVIDHYAYVVMDNFTLVPSNMAPPFRGIITIDMRSQSVVNEMNGMDPGADAIAGLGNTLVVSFMGQPLWTYSATNGKPEFKRSIWKFEGAGTPRGRATMDEENYYTCLSVPNPSHPGWMKKIAGSLDRRALQLD